MLVDIQEDISIDNFQLCSRSLFRICSVYIRRYLEIHDNKQLLYNADAISIFNG